MTLNDDVDARPAITPPASSPWVSSRRASLARWRPPARSFGPFTVRRSTRSEPQDQLCNELGSDLVRGSNDD